MKTRIHSLIPALLAVLLTPLTATTAFGQGLSFDGQSNYVQVDHFGVARDLTAEAWIRFDNDGSSGDRYLMGIEEKQGEDAWYAEWFWHLYVDGQGQLTAKYANNARNPWGHEPLRYKGGAPFMELTSGTGAIQSDQWYHVAFAVRTFTGPGASEGVYPCGTEGPYLEHVDYRAEGKLLIDGTVVATQEIRTCGLGLASPSTPSSPLFIGGHPSTTSFKGMIRDLRFSTVAHDQQFISDHMQSPASGNAYFARWPMTDLGALPQVADATDYPRHGTYAGTLEGTFTTTWTELEGKALDIGAGADGSVCIIMEGDRDVMRLNDDGYWDGMGLPGSARLDVSHDGRVVVVLENNEIWQYLPATDNWEQIPGSAIDVGFGADGSLWAVALDPLYRVLRWNSDGWEDMGAEASRIDVVPNGTAYIVQHDPDYFGANQGTILQYGGGGPGDWHRTPGNLRATDVALGISPHEAAWGAIWAIGPGGAIYRWSDVRYSDTGNGWEKTNGGSIAISADDDGNVLSIAGHGTIWQGDSPDSQ